MFNSNRLNQLVYGVTFFLFCAFGSTCWALDSSSTVHVNTLVKTTHSWNEGALNYPSGKAEVTGIMIEIEPGGETGWHQHPVPSFGLVLEGSLDISLKDGQVKHLQKGDPIVEVVNTLHNGRNNGKVPTKLIVFYAGSEGQKLTVKEGQSQ